MRHHGTALRSVGMYDSPTLFEQPLKQRSHAQVSSAANKNVMAMVQSIPGMKFSLIKGSTHYLGDKQDLDVSSEGPSSGNIRVYRLGSESIL